MSGFTPTCTTAGGLDARKRVDYHLGLVLGEDEFRQDQFHHRERDHHATRALHGYGTVSGLAVSYDDVERRLHVQPGLAVDPAGHLICVPVEHCAGLEGWLRDHASSDEVSGALPTSFPVFVLLCWTECETDEVPIPADSCLRAEDTRAPSRLMDSFELRLATEPPPPVGEVAPGSLGGIDQLVDELHGMLDISGGSPPDADGVADLLRDWAVHRRPEVSAGEACLPAPPGEACVLLARVDIDVVEGVSGIGIDGATVDDRDRPILVSTRLLQEAMFALGVDVEIPGHGHTLAGLGDVDLGTAPVAADVLTFDGADWVAAPPSGGGTDDHGALSGLDGDDHVQYLLADGSRPLAGDLSAGGNRLTDLPDSTADGQPIVEGQGAGGDLTGPYPDPRIAAIQTTPVEAPAPRERDVLFLRRDRWIAGRPWVLPFVTIERVDELRYAVWFNLDAPENRVAVAELDESNLVVQRETENGSFLRRVGPRGVNGVIRNVFTVEVSEESTPLRFTFALDRLPLSDGSTVLEWAERMGIWFVGQSGERDETVTAFTLIAARLG